MFKCERRKSFRLRLYPNQKSFAQIDVTSVIEAAAENPKKKQSELTGIFKRFLEEANKVKDGNYKTYRVYDISVSGLSLHCEPNEGVIFAKDQEFENIKIKIKNEEISIKEARVVYCKETRGVKDKLLDIRVAMEFQQISEKVESLLSKTIQSEMRNLDLREKIQFQEQKMLFQENLLLSLCGLTFASACSIVPSSHFAVSFVFISGSSR